MREALDALAVVGTSGFVALLVVLLSRDAVAELIRGKISSKYDRDLETHKATLQTHYGIAIERLRGELELTAVEHQIRFARVYERVADTVAAVYALLERLHRSVAKYVAAWESSAAPPKSELRQGVDKCVKNFRGYYRPRRLFIREETALKIDEFDRKLFRIAADFAKYVEGGDGYKPDDTDVWGQAADLVQTETPALFKALEHDFRVLLGIEREEAS